MQRILTRIAVCGAFLDLWVGLPAPAQAGMLTPGDILVSDIGFFNPSGVFEYTRTGSQVQTLGIPRLDDGSARGVTVDGAGNVLLFNGTFNPFLTSYNPVTGSAVSRTFPGWSTANATGYGGVGVYQNYAFVTDMATAGAGAPNGIVRFNTTDSTAQRFASGIDFITLLAV